MSTLGDLDVSRPHRYLLKLAGGSGSEENVAAENTFLRVTREGGGTVPLQYSPQLQGRLPTVQEKGFDALFCWKSFQGAHLVFLGSALPSNL